MGGSKSEAKVPKFGATLNCNISRWKQAFDKLSKARIFYYTWTYEVCQNKQQEEGQKVRQKYQNLGHLQTAIYQARNKLLTNFQNLESSTIHGHMRCVKISNKRRVKKWSKRAKIRFQDFE